MKVVENPRVTCSFCHRSSEHVTVDVLVAMPDGSAAICGECIEIARDILGFARHTRNEVGEIPPTPPTSPFRVIPGRWARPK